MKSNLRHGGLVMTECIDRGKQKSTNLSDLRMKRSTSKSQRGTGESSLLIPRVRSSTREQPSTNRSTHIETCGHDLRGGIEHGGDNTSNVRNRSQHGRHSMV